MLIFLFFFLLGLEWLDDIFDMLLIPVSSNQFNTQLSVRRYHLKSNKPAKKKILDKLIEGGEVWKFSFDYIINNMNFKRKGNQFLPNKEYIFYYNELYKILNILLSEDIAPGRKYCNP